MYVYVYFHVAQCISHIYIMAFTSGVSHAGSDNSAHFEIKVGNQVKSIQLSDRPGNDYYPNKGDIWDYPLSSFGIHTCTTPRDITGLAIIEGGNDGWNIQTIVVMASGTNPRYTVLSAAVGVNRWIDGNGSAQHKRYDLPLVRN